MDCAEFISTKETRSLFFPVLSPTIWKLMLIQDGKSKITPILESGFQERKLETIIAL